MDQPGISSSPTFFGAAGIAEINDPKRIDSEEGDCIQAIAIKRVAKRVSFSMILRSARSVGADGLANEYVRTFADNVH